MFKSLIAKLPFNKEEVINRAERRHREFVKTATPRHADRAIIRAMLRDKFNT